MTGNDTPWWVQLALLAVLAALLTAGAYLCHEQGREQGRKEAIENIDGRPKR